jgi:hypothetical protein
MLRRRIGSFFLRRSVLTHSLGLVGDSVLCPLCGTVCHSANRLDPHNSASPSINELCQYTGYILCSASQISGVDRRCKLLRVCV